MRPRTLDLLLAWLTLAVAVVAIVGVAMLGLRMMVWTERHLMEPLIVGILDSVPSPGSLSS